MSLGKGILLFGLTPLAVLLAIFYGLSPGSTPPIRDVKGNIIPGAIASLEKIRLGGMDQWILVRGEDTSNPVLLWLHGGPGAAQMAVSRHFNAALEADFVVVHWDQRGAGKSNPQGFDEQTMTFDRFLSDAHELTLYLKERFDSERIYLVGHSWGSHLGLHLARKYPQDYHAYIAIGQLVDPPRGQVIAHHWLRQQIEASQSQKDLERLEALGSPPFEAQQDYVKLAGMVAAYGGGMDVGMLSLAWIALGAPEYRPADYLSWFRGAARGSGPMWEETQSFNAFREVPRLEIPVYFFSGTRDYNTPIVLIQEYFEALEAPRGKHMVVFEDSAHTPFMAEPGRFQGEMEKVKEATYPRD